jgi:hypothetical protein
LIKIALLKQSLSSQPERVKHVDAGSRRHIFWDVRGGSHGANGRDILVSENVDAAGFWMDAGAGL